MAEPIERTPLREAFFSETRTDPYMAALTDMMVFQWATGYERALRDLVDRGLIPAEVAYEESFSELRRKAQGAITEQRNESNAKAIVAMAEIARVNPGFLP